MPKISQYPDGGFPQETDEIIARRSGSNVKLKLLTAFVAETNSENIFRCDNPGGTSAFVGTINTLPGGATLTYNVTSGQEAAMVPAATTQLGKLRLYNTTRGTSALISNCNTGTNTLTLTANVPAGWLVGDTITIASQTVSGGSVSWVDIEITSGLNGVRALFVDLVIRSTTPGDFSQIHPFETYGATKVSQSVASLNGVSNYKLCLVKVTSNILTIAWSGTPNLILIREFGHL